MGLFDRWRTVAAVAVDQEVEHRPAAAGKTFDVGPDEIDPALFGLPSWDSTWAGPAPRIDRRSAMQVPGVKRARDIICQTIGGLPIEFVDAGNHVRKHPLLTQPERNVPRSITMINTLDDMLFEGIAVWRITETDADGFPLHVRRLLPKTIDLSTADRVYTKADGGPQGTTRELIPDAELIRFYSPTDPLVEAGARAIRTAIALDAAAARYADDPMASGYFRATEGADPLVDDQEEDESDEEYDAREGNAITALVRNWRRARQQSGTGYVPQGLEYVPLDWDPAQLQLAEGRQHAVLEISRVTGIDAEDLGVSTTSRTYANSTQKREELRDYTLAPFSTAITDRLSMPDITRPVWRARVNFRSFIEADELTRMQTYAAAKAVGAYGTDEVQRREGLPAVTVATPPAAVTPPVRQLRAVNAEAAAAGITFAAEPARVIGFVGETGHTFEVDVEARVIFGLVIPWGATSSLNRGVRYRFDRGSVVLPTDISRVKLMVQHDRSTAVAYATEFADSPPGTTRPGLYARFKVESGPEGDRALQKAADKIWDGLSVGLSIDSTFDFSTSPAVARQAIVSEVSLTPDPSFTDSRVHSVRASNSPGEDDVMPCTVCGQIHEAGAPPCAAPPANVSRETELQNPSVGPTFASDLANAMVAAMATAQEGGGPRPIVLGNPQGTGTPLQVAEPAPYRFDGLRASHCFSTDLQAMFAGDSEAAQRVDQFMAQAGPQFNVTVANAQTINPNTNRPDLYVDQREFEYPIWTAINKGGLTDNTPFVLPKFSAASGLVADHVEGTEPTGGAFATTSQTITPTALSGKVIINREVWDQGGNPQLDSILWRQIVRAYYEGLEAAAVTFINALAPTTITITTAAADAALEASLTSQLVPLQYIRGGNRFRDFFVQVDLMKALVAAKDTAGRKLFPVIGPQNASGTVSAFYESVNVGGLIGRPSWALAASGSVAANSFLFDRGDISSWASAPRKITMDQTAVATVALGVWGYKALACTDLTGLRFVSYDPV